MSMLIYLLKTVVIQLLIFAGYRILLDREPWGNIKRVYLLAGLVLSFAVPILTVDKLVPGPVNELSFSSSFSELPITAASEVAGSSDSLIFTLVALLYGSGFCLFLFRFIRSVQGVRQRLQVGAISYRGGLRLVRLPYEVPTHTFMLWIFHTSAVELSPEILAHEAAHARQLHTVDRLFVALLRVICWFNPVLWLYDRAIRENHELLADRAVLQAGWNPITYQQRLLSALQKLNGTPALGSGAGFSLTKKRFKMMYVSSGHWSRSLVKITGLCLLWAFLILGFAKEGMAQVLPPPPPTAPAAPPAPPAPPSPPMTGQDPIPTPPAPPSPPVIDWNKVEKRVPSAAQLQDWQSAEKYGVWIDGKRIANEALKQFAPADFSFFTISKLARNAVNYGNHTFQLNLMTAGYFDALRAQSAE